MAGSKLKTKLRASTILEVLVAMAIIILVFGIALMIYSNVLRLSLSAKKVRAEAVLQETILKTEHSKIYTAQTFQMDGLRIEQEVKPFDNDTLLFEIELSAFDQNQQKITGLQKVVSK